MTTSTNRSAGIGATSAARSLGTGSSRVLGCLSRLFAVVASLRSLARIQPFCTNVSLPSGRTSLIVACRSTSEVEDRTQRWTAPPPMTAVFVTSGAETYERADPGGYCFQRHCHWDAFPHSPPAPVLPV